MKQKKQILALLFFIVSAPIVFSQNDNAAEANIKYNLFKGDYKAKKYDTAYENWMWCMDNHPTMSVNLYKYGIKIANHKLKTATTEAEKVSTYGRLVGLC